MGSGRGALSEGEKIKLGERGSERRRVEWKEGSVVSRDVNFAQFSGEVELLCQVTRKRES